MEVVAVAVVALDRQDVEDEVEEEEEDEAEDEAEAEEAWVAEEVSRNVEEEEE